MLFFIAKKFRKILNLFISIFCSMLLLFMVVMALWQIFTRYLLNNPSTLSESLMIYAFVWLALFGSAFVFGKKDHMAMVYLRKKFDDKSPMIKLILAILTETIIFLFAFFVLILGGASIASLAMGQLVPALGISMGIVYLALPTSGAVLILYNILNIIDLFNKKEDN